MTAHLLPSRRSIPKHGDLVYGMIGCRGLLEFWPHQGRLQGSCELSEILGVGHWYDIQ